MSNKKQQSKNIITNLTCQYETSNLNSTNKTKIRIQSTVYPKRIKVVGTGLRPINGRGRL